MAKLTQEQLLEIFQALKKELKPYEKGSVVARMDIEGKYDLWSEMPAPGVLIYDRLRTEVAFAAIIVQSSYVGFYFMPVYGSEKIKAAIPPRLMKTLKGKACFHIKNTDPELMMQVKQVLKLGYDGYEKLGWVK